MNTENNKPLYVRLNEERTQGEWVLEQLSSWNQISNDKAIVRAEIVSKNLWERVAEFDLTTLTGRTNLLGGSPKSDAQYTALAVNNLHILAEALEAFNRMYIDEKMPSHVIADKFHEMSKEALKAIS